MSTNSWTTMLAVKNARSITGSARAVLYAMATYATGETGEDCFPSQDEIAAASGLARRAVNRQLADLEHKYGVIERVGVRRVRGGKPIVKWRIRLDRLAACGASGAHSVAECVGETHSNVSLRPDECVGETHNLLWTSQETSHSGKHCRLGAAARVSACLTSLLEHEDESDWEYQVPLSMYPYSFDGQRDYDQRAAAAQNYLIAAAERIVDVHPDDSMTVDRALAYICNEQAVTLPPREFAISVWKAWKHPEQFVGAMKAATA